MAVSVAGTDPNWIAGQMHLLRTEFDRAHAAGMTVAALIDPASHPGTWREFERHAVARGGGSLLTTPPSAAGRTVVPLVIPLRPEDDALHNAIAKVARASSAVIWVGSDLPYADLASKLAAKLEAQLEQDRQLITLRYYDPRVLPVLLQMLAPPQRAVLNDGVRAWWWLDRTLAFTSSLPERVETPGLMAIDQAGIQLSDDQVNRLLEASRIDRVLDLLARTHPDALRGLERASRYSVATELLAHAAQWGLESEFDSANYIAVACQEGEGFAETPAWRPLMLEVRSGRMTFGDAIATWEARDDPV